MATRARQIQLPADPSQDDGIWRARWYQKRAWAPMHRGVKRSIQIWHRRAGKDDFALAWASVAAATRIGTYYHLLPMQNQARRAIWDAVDPHRHRRRIDLAFPEQIRKRTLENDMRVEFVNGSTWQVLGSDNYDALVGSPPVGLVFSEWALSNPRSWAYLRPILAENGGWAIFITTPRGRNHAYRMFQAALKSPHWDAQMLTAEESGVFTPEALEIEREEYLSEYGAIMGKALFEQEYMCSWEAAIPGAFWAHELNQLEAAGRLCEVPIDPALPVHTSRDLGMNDENVTFYWQIAGPQIRMVDIDVHRNAGLEIQFKDMRARGYNLGTHVAPHDIRVRELGTGKSRFEVAQDLGIQFQIAPSIPLQDGISAVRQIIPRLWVDRERCGEAFEILKSYRAEYDEKRQTTKPRPLHDFASNYADSVRYFAVSSHLLGELGGSLDYSAYDSGRSHGRKRRRR